MKHYKIIDPVTTTEFDVEDDEILIQKIGKISEKEQGIPLSKYTFLTQKNLKTYPTEK